MGTAIFTKIWEIVNRPLFKISAEKYSVLEHIRTCRTAALGGRVLKCPECGEKIIDYNSCNKRGCPVCSARNQYIWERKIASRILPVSHYHLVFSIPQAYTIEWLTNKRAVMDILFSSVSKAIRSIEKDSGVLTGSVLVFQSHARGMAYKPHIHCMLSAGGITKEGKWVGLGSINYTKMIEIVEKVFEREIAKKITGAKLPEKKEINKREWTVHPTYHENSGNSIIGYLANTAMGAVINLAQEFDIDSEKKTIGFTETHEGKEVKTVLNEEVFVDRYLNHIPPSGSVTVRYYGYYSNRHAEEIKRIRKTFPKEEQKEAYIERCPVCNTPLVLMFNFERNTTIEKLESILAQRPPG